MYNFIVGLVFGILLGVLADRGYLKKAGGALYADFKIAVAKKKAIAAANK